MGRRKAKIRKDFKEEKSTNSVKKGVVKFSGRRIACAKAPRKNLNRQFEKCSFSGWLEHAYTLIKKFGLNSESRGHNEGFYIRDGYYESFVFKGSLWLWFEAGTRIENEWLTLRRDLRWCVGGETCSKTMSGDVQKYVQEVESALGRGVRHKEGWENVGK